MPSAYIRNHDEIHEIFDVFQIPPNSRPRSFEKLTCSDSGSGHIHDNKLLCFRKTFLLRRRNFINSYLENSPLPPLPPFDSAEQVTSFQFPFSLLRRFPWMFDIAQMSGRVPPRTDENSYWQTDFSVARHLGDCSLCLTPYFKYVTYPWQSLSSNCSTACCFFLSLPFTADLLSFWRLPRRLVDDAVSRGTTILCLVIAYIIIISRRPIVQDNATN